MEPEKSGNGNGNINNEEVESERKSDDQSYPKGKSSRTYECIYCKRGFSNAQALGGHMNIHRKDRARPTKPIRPIGPTSSSPLPHNNVAPRMVAPAPSWMIGAVGGPDARHLTLFAKNGLNNRLGNRPEDVEELDLELRLGPKRPGDNVPMELREFLRCKFDW